jgi:hypothetical protein
MLLRYTQLGRLTRFADTSTKKPPTLRRSGQGEAALLVKATRGKARRAEFVNEAASESDVDLITLGQAPNGLAFEDPIAARLVVLRDTIGSRDFFEILRQARPRMAHRR